jgi:pimeloyl-ACP methyl ester carboxylesterase
MQSDADRSSIPVRRYGGVGPTIVLIHGGPGAPGSMASIARSLSNAFRVLEPFQRGSGGEPLTVARHVFDLHEVVQLYCDERPVLVGHSWGAMLALAYAAEYPNAASSIVLIGCGTFDEPSRARLSAVRRERMARVAGVSDFDPDRHITNRCEWTPDRLAEHVKRYQRIDSVELVSHEDETVAFDLRAYEDSWSDMMRLQQDGIYPAAFATIRLPAMMLHGVADPHPGRMIHSSLVRYMSQLEYSELDRCGHYPWLEVSAADSFYATLRGWLARHAG